MAFSFGSSQPSTSGLFGQTQTQNTGTTGLFGQQQQQQQQGAPGATASPFGAAPQSTPFGASAASKPLFGAASTPSMFGGAAASTPAFSFTPASTQSFLGNNNANGAPATQSQFGTGFGTGAPGGFGTMGAAPTMQRPQHPQLLTKDHRPIAHSSNWDDLSPQAQQYLLDLEKIVAKCSQECKQLEDQDRLMPGDDATTDIMYQARIIHQNISALSIREGFDATEVEGLRKAAVHLVRHTEAAVYSFKRATAWRNMTKTNASSHSLEEIGPPMSLPYPFLEETLEEFNAKLKAQLAAVYELEVTIKEKSRTKKGTPDTSLAALQASIANLHDCVMKVAAMIQSLDDRVHGAKSKILSSLSRRGGMVIDPFRQAANDERDVRRFESDAVTKTYEELKSVREKQVGTY